MTTASTRPKHHLQDHYKTKIIDGVRHRRCNSCEKWKPENYEHFHYRFKPLPFAPEIKPVFQAACKPCMNSRANRRKGHK